ncbi:hypothetical protein EVA_20079 [gut metagenome]|uniref:Uncharacterized protein n=1 Tax=gut metagenome TaxID=749906 RepID=J9FBJ9_9ZZZZ
MRDINRSASNHGTHTLHPKSCFVPSPHRRKYPVRYSEGSESGYSH